MIRDVLGWLDYSRCAEIALVLFATAFFAVALRLWSTPRQEAEGYAVLPLSDGVEDAHAEN